MSRAESLSILLERSTRQYSQQEKCEMAERKNGYYRALLTSLTPADVLPGVADVLRELRALGASKSQPHRRANAGTISTASA